MKRAILIVAGIFIGQVASLRGQDFTNLNFESAQVIISTNIGVNNYIASANALPGWSAFSGTNQLSLIAYNPGGLTVISDPVYLVGSNAFVISGNFSVFLNYGSISQTALVPANDQSLLFDVTDPYLFAVTLGGQSLSYTPISSGTTSYGDNYSTYAANISAFAGGGGVETLTFSGGGILDDIQFSPELIPEPSPSWLFFFGSGFLFYVRNRNKSSD